MFRAFSSIRIVTLGMALATTAAFADEEQNQTPSVEQKVAGVVFVAETLPETRVEQQSNLEGIVDTMVQSEVMLDLTARLATTEPQT